MHILHCHQIHFEVDISLVHEKRGYAPSAQGPGAGPFAATARPGPRATNPRNPLHFDGIEGWRSSVSD